MNITYLGCFLCSNRNMITSLHMGVLKNIFSHIVFLNYNFILLSYFVFLIKAIFNICFIHYAL